MKTEVYSWRVSSELKSSLERESRLRKTSVAEALRQAAEEWLSRSPMDIEDAAEQRRLLAVVLQCAGTISDPGLPSSQNVSQIVRSRLKRRYGR